jgi:hypothetical protein
MADKTIDDIFNEKEARRVRAMQSGNCRRYAVLCNDLGLKPEDQSSYEIGEADVLYANQQTKAIERGIEADKYKIFIKETKRRGLNPDDTLDSEQAIAKQKLMAEIFGYTSLRGSSKVSEQKRKDHQIGLAFKERYYASIKKL